MKLIKRVLCAAIALSVAGCTTSKQVSAPKSKIAGSTRSIVGTSLIGARGKTTADQDKIDDTAAGLCGAKVWRPSECQRHQKDSAL